MRISSIALTLLLLTAGSAAQAAELRVEGPELARLIQTAFNGTVMRLDHDSVAANGVKTPGSFVRLGPNLQNQRFAFSIPEQRFALGIGSAVYDINDINSDPNYLFKTRPGTRLGQNIAVAAIPTAYLITIRFEDEGTEILGHAAGRLASMRRSVVPNVEVNNVSLQIALFPQSINGAISFKPSRVTFFGDIQAQGLANLTIAGRHVDIIDGLTDYKSSIKQQVELEVKNLIDRNLPLIAASLQREVLTRGKSVGVRVKGIRFDGTSVIISGESLLQ